MRGQAIDCWKARVNANTDALKEKYHPVQHHRTNYMINREYVAAEEDYCGPQVFNLAQAVTGHSHRAVITMIPTLTGFAR